jgi:hypothetical protein
MGHDMMYLLRALIPGLAVQASKPSPPSRLGEDAALRQLLLAARHLRLIGMNMTDHVGNATDGSALDVARLRAIAQELYDSADYIHDWAAEQRSDWFFKDEQITLGTALDEAVSAVMRAADLSARNWQPSPDIMATQLRIDRRALRHLLIRALSLALRATRQHDVIRIDLETRPHAAAVVITATAAGSAHALGTRVTAAGMALASQLIERQGGSLEIDVPDIGQLRIAIVVPPERLTHVRSHESEVARRMGSELKQRDDRTTENQVT